MLPSPDIGDPVNAPLPVKCLVIHLVGHSLDVGGAPENGGGSCPAAGQLPDPGGDRGMMDTAAVEYIYPYIHGVLCDLFLHPVPFGAAFVGEADLLIHRETDLLSRDDPLIVRDYDNLRIPVLQTVTGT